MRWWKEGNGLALFEHDTSARDLEEEEFVAAATKKSLHAIDSAQASQRRPISKKSHR
jgi:hypothetical protein